MNSSLTFILFSVIVILIIAFNLLRKKGLINTSKWNFIVSVFTIAIIILSIGILSHIFYFNTRNTKDFITSISLMIITLMLYSILEIFYINPKYKRLIKFIGFPAYFILVFFIVRYINTVTLRGYSYFVFICMFIGSRVGTYIKKEKAPDNFKNLCINGVYITLLIIIYMGLFKIYDEDVSPKNYCMRKLERYLIEGKGYKEKDFDIRVSTDLVRGGREIMIVYFRGEDKSIPLYFDMDGNYYIYEYFYDTDAIKQIVAIKKEDGDFVNKEKDVKVEEHYIIK